MQLNADSIATIRHIAIKFLPSSREHWGYRFDGWMWRLDGGKNDKE